MPSGRHGFLCLLTSDNFAYLKETGTLQVMRFFTNGQNLDPRSACALGATREQYIQEFFLKDISWRLHGLIVEQGTRFMKKIDIFSRRISLDRP
jgi:hypothetical protein